MNTSIHVEGLVYTVSELNRGAKLLLETHFPTLYVEGEISNLREPSSGHLYFSLKDPHAQIRCALFRMKALTLNFKPKDGMHVLMRGRISLYEERGEYQFIAEYMEETGDGALRRAFEALKKRLAQEGLFATSQKKALPKIPRCIGVITSPTGAAIRDILSVLKRRFPCIPIIIYPTQVQGAEASGQIVQALTLSNQRKECDVLILSRGGGSLEDLWPFNEEKVARAIYDSQIPIVTGIGHEIDTTIAEFVADQRAATPSAAAELVTPDAAEWITALLRIQARLHQAMQMSFRHLKLWVQSLEKRLVHPKHTLENQAQHLDMLEHRLLLAHSHLLRNKQTKLDYLFAQLMHQTPDHLVQRLMTCTVSLRQRLLSSLEHHMKQRQEKLAHLMRALDQVSPLNTLSRGYAILTKDGEILSDTTHVYVGDTLHARLAQGSLECLVNKKDSKPPLRHCDSERKRGGSNDGPRE